MMEKIELYLISGFLGAGKTTFLTRLLNSISQQRIGVIVNEFGDVGVDGRIIASNGIKLVEINNGSIFCACLKDGFVRTLKAFSEQPIDLLFIESSGLADPADMDGLLKSLSPYLKKPYDNKGMICLIDSTTFLDYVDVLVAVQNQAAVADYFLVNKIDLVERAQLDEIHRVLRACNDRALIFDTLHADIPLPLPVLNSMPERGDCKNTNTPSTRPSVYTVETESHLDASSLRCFCERLQKDTFRIKGMLLGPEAWLHVDSVGAQISVKESNFQNPFPHGRLTLIARERQSLTRAISSAWAECCGVPMELYEA